MPRVSRFLGVFLISLCLFSVSVFAYQQPSKKDWLDFANCFDGKKISVSDASKFKGKEFIISGNTCYISSGFLALDEIVYNVNAKDVNCYLYIEDNWRLITSSDVIRCKSYFGDAMMKVEFGENASGSFSFGLGKNCSSADLLPVDDQLQFKSKPKEKPKEEKPKEKPKEKPVKIEGDNVLDSMINAINDFFKILAWYGLRIISASVALGVIFCGGRWLWRKLIIWLNNS